MNQIIPVAIAGLHELEPSSKQAEKDYLQPQNLLRLRPKLNPLCLLKLKMSKASELALPVVDPLEPSEEIPFRCNYFTRNR